MTKEIAIITKAEGLIIKDGEGMKIANEVLSNLNKELDFFNAELEKLTEPANKILKEAREKYYPIIKPLKAAVEDVRIKMKDYATNIGKERAKLAERIGEGRGHLTMEKAVKKIEALGDIDNRTIGEAGDTTFVSRDKMEVVDLALVPIEYHLADEVKIRKAMKEGVKLPGVRYFTVMEPRNFR